MDLSLEELKEVMVIFQAESQEHLESLNKRLLELEKNPKNISLLEEIFRSAHSLKGAARMIGLNDIEKIAHDLESVFGYAKRSELTLSSDLFDVIYEGVDAISKIVSALSEGKPSPINVDEMVAKLQAIKPGADLSAIQSKTAQAQPAEKLKEEVKKSPETKSVEPAQSKAEVKTEVVKDEGQQLYDQGAEKVVFDTSAELSVERRQEHGRRQEDKLVAGVPTKEEETIRISTKKLDDLMNQGGELLTIKIKDDQRISELKSLSFMCDEWNRMWETGRSVLNKISKIKAKGVEEFSLASLTPVEARKIVSLLEYNKQEFTAISQKINELLNNYLEDSLRASLIVDELQESVKKVRLLPIGTIFNQYPRMVRDLAKYQSKEVQLVIEGADTQVDKKILEELKDPLMHCIRNSIDHGIEMPDDREAKGKPRAGTVKLSARYLGSNIIVEVEDDGKGINVNEVAAIALKKGFVSQHEIKGMSETEIINLIFRPGFSTAKIITDISGRGVGLDVVRINIERLKGLIELHSKIGKGTKFTIKLPLTLATLQALLVESAGEIYTFPVTAVEKAVRITEDDVSSVGAMEVINVDGSPVPLVRLDDILENPRRISPNGNGGNVMPTKFQNKEHKLPAVILASAEKRVAFLVDKLIDEQEIVVKNLGSQLKRVRNVAGATILGDRRIAMILDTGDLMRSVQTKTSGKRIATAEGKSKEKLKRKILIVDDSITTRTLEKNILESAGYDITVAFDGLEALTKIKGNKFDLVVSDVEMPNMNGFQLAESIKKDPKFHEIPVILCTSLESEADKRRGIEAGADAYITKGTFDQSNLLETIERLI